MLSLGLIFIDQRTQLLEPVRAWFIGIAAPFYQLGQLPGAALESGEQALLSREQVIAENAKLKSESLVLKAKVQKLASLAAENVRLRELLNSSAVVQENVLAAEVIGVSPELSNHFVLINKGSKHGVYIGQSVIDAYGLFGQIIEVGDEESRVLMISDATHAVPVQVNRNGGRAIAKGVGRLHELSLEHVAATTDLQVGDLLVSSGLGGRFPVGYPVAQISEVTHDPGKDFAIVKALPSAELDRAKHVLIVFSKKLEQPQTRLGAQAAEAGDAN